MLTNCINTLENDAKVVGIMWVREAQSPESVGLQILSLRQLLSRQRSPPPGGTDENPSFRAVHAPKPLTERTAPEPEFVSLRPVFSKPPDFAKTVRIFKRLICQRYSA